MHELLVIGWTAVAAQLSGPLPDQLAEFVQSLPKPTEPIGILLYAAWGVFTFRGGKKLFGRFRSSQAPAPTVQEDTSAVNTGATTVGSKSNESDASGFGQSAAFMLPSFVPVSKGVRKVTSNEVHALELGSVVGFITLWLFHIGRRDAGLGLTVLFVGGALGYKRYKSKAFKTIRMEPWYALMAFAFGAIVGALFFDPTLLTQYLSGAPV